MGYYLDGMSLRQRDFSRQGERLQIYLDGLTEAAGHADRVVPIENYTKGLMLPIERKSVEPMAARLAPGNVRQMHQSLHHIVADAAWNDDALLRQIRCQVLPAITRKHALAAWIVDDTGFPKKGTHSVGVTRQYCGQLGKQENCRVAVSVSLATEAASIPVAYRLYLPETWAHDEQRRKQAGVPKEISFETKPEIALGQIRSLVNEDVPRGVVLADAAYGNDHGFRDGLVSLELRVRVAHRDSWRKEPHPEQWLLIEWPKTEKEPSKYWLSNLPASITLRKLVATAKLRWRIERDYEELKQELGLGHFEGRNWRGFHHHATLSIAAYGFLVLERCLFPPSGNSGRVQATNIQLQIPRVQPDYTPRGAAPAHRTA